MLRKSGLSEGRQRQIKASMSEQAMTGSASALAEGDSVDLAAREVIVEEVGVIVEAEVST